MSAAGHGPPVCLRVAAGGPAARGVRGGEVAARKGRAGRPYPSDRSIKVRTPSFAGLLKGRENGHGEPTGPSRVTGRILAKKTHRHLRG